MHKEQKVPPSVEVALEPCQFIESDWANTGNLFDLKDWRAATRSRERQLRAEIKSNLLLREENERLRDELDRYPAKWWDDSSLATWFPFTAEEMTRMKAELAALRASASSETPGEAYQRGFKEGVLRSAESIEPEPMPDLREVAEAIYDTILDLKPLPYVAPTATNPEKATADQSA